MYLLRKSSQSKSGTVPFWVHQTLGWLHGGLEYLVGDVLNHLSGVYDAEGQCVCLALLVEWEGEEELFTVLQHLYLPFYAPLLEDVLAHYGLAAVHANGEAVAGAL